MNRTRRLGALVVSAVAAAPFAYLWIGMMASADEPLTLRLRLDMALWTAVFGTPLMVAATGLAGIAGCIGYTTHYLVNYPSTPRIHPPTTSPTLPPETALVLATALAGCLWLALVPPRRLLASRAARRSGLAMAAVLVAGFLLQARPSLAAQLGLGGVVGRNPK